MTFPVSVILRCDVMFKKCFHIFFLFAREYLIRAKDNLLTFFYL